MSDNDDADSEQGGPAQDPRDRVDAGTSAGVQAQRKRIKHDVARGDEFWHACLQDAVGRAEIWEFLKLAGAFAVPFSQSSAGFPSTEQTWFMAGQQSLGLKFFMRLMRIDFIAVNLMLTENEPAFQAQKAKK